MQLAHGYKRFELLYLLAITLIVGFISLLTAFSDRSLWSIVAVPICFGISFYLYRLLRRERKLDETK